MLTFAVVASMTGEPFEPRFQSRLAERAAAEVPFTPDRQVTWANASETVWFCGWQAPQRGVRDEPAWSVDSEGLTAFTGKVWPRRDGWSGTGQVAALLRKHLERRPLGDSVDELAGVYVIASLARNGPCSVGTDPVGAGLLYCARSPRVVVLSTRAAVAAALRAAATDTTSRRDAFGAVWLAYMGFAMGDWTGFEDVTLVPDGAVVEIEPPGTITFRRPSRPAWRHHADELATHPRASLEEARGEMATAIRTALSSPGTQGCLGLTGGKDSRLVLALLLAEGLAPGIECQTYGEDDLPDVVVARELASTFGLRHVARPGKAERWAWRQRVNDAVRGSTEQWPSREVGFRITAWVTSGMRNAGEQHLGRPPRADKVLLSGLFGEALRTDYAGTIRFRSKDEAARFPDWLGAGSAGILTPDALSRYRAEVHKLLFEGAAEHDSPQDVIDTFYLRQRVRRWLGTTLEVDSENRVFPLYSITALRLAFAIGAENRHAEWIHYHLMRTACERLVRLPLSSRDWQPGAGGELVAPTKHSDPVPLGPPPPTSRPYRLVRRRIAGLLPRQVRAAVAGPVIRAAGREARAKARATDVEVMRRLFRHDPANQAFELIDASAASRALDRFDDLSESQRTQIYGALTAVIWLGGHEVPLPRELSAT